MRRAVGLLPLSFLVLAACSSGGSTAAPAVPVPSAPTAPAATPTAATPTTAPPATPATAPTAPPAAPTTAAPAPTPSGGPVPPGFTASGISFPDARNGWALGGTQCSTFPCPSFLLRTTDGGATWASVPAPISSAKQLVTSVVLAPDLRTGFTISQPALETTSDAGAHWTLQPTVAGIAGAVVSAVVATATGTWISVGTEKDPSAILAMAPPGSTTFAAVPGIPKNGGLTSLVASGGVVYGVLVGVSGDVSDSSLLRVAGGAVTTVSLPRGADCAVTASSATAVLAECGRGSGGGSSGSRELYGSVDSGATFTKLPSPGAGAGYDDAGLFDLGGGHAVVGTMSAPAAQLLATTDGTSWRPVLSFTNHEGGVSLIGLTFPIPNVGFVAVTQATGPKTSTSQLYVSTDKGQTWKAMNF